MFIELKMRLILFSSILLFGSFATLFVSTSITGAFSQTNESLYGKNMLIGSNFTGTPQLSNDTNLELLEILGLTAVYQSIDSETTKIMNLADQSMNLTNSFGVFPLASITTDMQEQYRGIPSDQDTERRNEAKNLLENNPYLSFIGMTLPNGDTYFSEPFFPSQVNSSEQNYGYRDHIIGALESKRPYLSNVISAASTGQPLVVLASPIFSGMDANNTLIGVLALGLNLNQFDELIKSQSTGKNDTRILLLDNNGTEISDSESNMNNLESFEHLKSFEDARDGKMGSMVEEVGGKSVTVSYVPINFAQSKWILLLISP